MSLLPVILLLVNGFKTVKDGGMPITMVVIPQTPGNALMVNGIVLIPMAIWSPDGRWSIKNGIIWMRMVLEQLVGS
jgi:hypothetical protein